MKKAFIKLEEIDLDNLVNGIEVEIVHDGIEVHIILADIGMERIVNVVTKAHWKYRGRQNAAKQ